MLMAWGPFRFSVPTYSVDALSRSIDARVEAQPVIGAAPPIHKLGPQNETVSLRSTFYPQHLNGGGIAQLTGVREAVNLLTPLPLVHVNGLIPNIFGLWIAKSISDEQEMFDSFGRPQSVSVTLELMQEGGPSSAARAIAQRVVSGFSELF